MHAFIKLDQLEDTAYSSDLTRLSFVQQKAIPHKVNYLFLVHMYIKWYHAWKCKGYSIEACSLLITR